MHKNNQRSSKEHDYNILASSWGETFPKARSRSIKQKSRSTHTLRTLRGARPARGRGGAQVGARRLLPQLHVAGGEEPVPALAQPAPPAVINHLDVGDDVIGRRRSHRRPLGRRPESSGHPRCPQVSQPPGGRPRQQPSSWRPPTEALRGCRVLGWRIHRDGGVPGSAAQ